MFRRRCLRVFACMAALPGLVFPAFGRDVSFDYYVLALSWSPAYCATPESSSSKHQCEGRKVYGFIVHGLWPQKERGGLVTNCRPMSSISRNDVERLFSVMPDERLIRYQWKKHGSCAEMRPEDYAGAIVRAFSSLDLSGFDPSRFLQADEARQRLLRDNRQLSGESVRLICRRGVFREVRICLTRTDLMPRPCPSSLRENCF